MSTRSLYSASASAKAPRTPDVTDAAVVTEGVVVSVAEAVVAGAAGVEARTVVDGEDEAAERAAVQREGVGVGVGAAADGVVVED